MPSPAELLRVALIDGGVGTNPAAAGAWPVFVSHLPDTPDNAICVYDTTGTSDGRDVRNARRVEHPGFQVRVRSLGYTTGWDKIRAIEALLDGILRQQVEVDAVTYTIHAVHRRGTTLVLGQQNDAHQRDAFTTNGILTHT